MARETLNSPRGTKDWVGEEALNRELIIDAVQKICKLYGYSPISTPSLERKEILEAGYRGSLTPSFFRILDRGNSLQRRYMDLTDSDSEAKHNSQNLNNLTDLGLRYDLTIPTSRIIEQYNLNEYFPLKRYQIGTIWRTEKPSAARLREFTVCDMDVFGTTNPVDDAEAVLLIYDIFGSLKIPVEILVNNRKLITAIDSRQCFQGSELTNDICEMEQKYGDLAIAQEGIAELRQVFDILKMSHIKSSTVKFAPNLRRSLNYYSGTIIEARVLGREGIRSPINGGRYNETPGTFTGSLIPTVGLSMSIERMQTALGVFSKDVLPNFVPDVLVTITDRNLIGFCIRTATVFRARGIKTMVFSNPDAALKNQLKFADKNRIRFVAIVKDNEIVLRDLITGEQKNINLFEEDEVDLSFLIQK